MREVTTRDGRRVELTGESTGGTNSGEYVARLDGTVVATVGYQTTADIIVFTHTGTDPALEGQGIASQLVRYALDDVRATPAPSGAVHRRFIAACPFVAAYVRDHPDDYADLDYRSRTATVHD